ncbi:MAG: ABC transporter ATP-binding protein [Nitrospira sp.]|nr:ABC transporter ATP-binding protein [Nitrospira sp.]
MDAITIEHVTKVYAPRWPWHRSSAVLTDVSLSVTKGEIFGFLGHNGAGKTTTMKILLGLLRPTSGRVDVLGAPAGDVATHSKLGYLPEAPYFYDYLTAEEFLEFYGKLAGMSHDAIQNRIPILLEQVGLQEAQHRQLRKFSKGMLQRIGLAQALIQDPELVVLDEPMSGLDPMGRKEVRDLILTLREQGKTVFFSTHILSDVEMVCDRVGILAKGKMLALGKVEDLIDAHIAQSIEVVCDGVIGKQIEPVQRLALRILQSGTRCLMVLPGHECLDEILEALRRAGAKLVSIIPHKGSLEELFVQKSHGEG